MKQRKNKDILNLIRYDKPSIKASEYIKGKFNKQKAIKILQDKKTNNLIELTYNDLLKELNIYQIKSKGE